jgi:hypothetical protein
MSEIGAFVAALTHELHEAAKELHQAQMGKVEKDIDEKITKFMAILQVNNVRLDHFLMVELHKVEVGANERAALRGM